VLEGLRARPNEIKAQSSRPTWKNCPFWLCSVHCWNATQYYSTETVLLIFPLLQTNITVQMKPSGGCFFTYLVSFGSVLLCALHQSTISWTRSLCGLHTLLFPSVRNTKNQQFLLLTVAHSTYKSKPLYYIIIIIVSYNILVVLCFFVHLYIIYSAAFHMYNKIDVMITVKLLIFAVWSTNFFGTLNFGVFLFAELSIIQ